MGGWHRARDGCAILMTDTRRDGGPQAEIAATAGLDVPDRVLQKALCDQLRKRRKQQPGGGCPADLQLLQRVRDESQTDAKRCVHASRYAAAGCCTIINHSTKSTKLIEP